MEMAKNSQNMSNGNESRKPFSQKVRKHDSGEL